ncbi:MAG: DUF6316 family protein [Gammaproteobacteria bacterium]|nr:DUF6316 family protein [Gammaproteobacteria bacterium]
MENRTGESGLLPFRTRRVFNLGNEWFFAVRDEKDYGPFENQQQAENELARFLNSFQL